MPERAAARRFAFRARRSAGSANFSPSRSFSPHLQRRVATPFFGRNAHNVSAQIDANGCVARIKIPIRYIVHKKNECPSIEIFDAQLFLVIISRNASVSAKFAERQARTHSSPDGQSSSPSKIASRSEATSKSPETRALSAKTNLRPDPPQKEKHPMGRFASTSFRPSSSRALPVSLVLPGPRR